MKNLKFVIVGVIVVCLAALYIVLGTMGNPDKENQEKEAISDIQPTDLSPEEGQLEGQSTDQSSADGQSPEEMQATDLSPEETRTDTEAGSKVTEDPAVGAVSVPKGNWTIVLQPEIKQTVRMAAFLNESFGVTGGFSSTGKTHYTTDGGLTWTKNELSGGCLYGVEIVDTNVVWVCGRMKGVSFTDPGGLRMSTDGGKNLGPTSNYETVPGECPMSFLDDKRGWISQSNKVSETLDGGLNFNDISLPEGLGNIMGIAVFEEGNDMSGCILSQDGILYVTKDHGASWTNYTLPLKEKYVGYQFGKFESAPAAIRFFDTDNALVAVSLTGSQEPLIIGFRTADGGKTWTDELIDKGQGSIYLSPDGRYVTIYHESNNVTVYRFDTDDNNEK